MTKGEKSLTCLPIEVDLKTLFGKNWINLGYNYVEKNSTLVETFFDKIKELMKTTGYKTIPRRFSIQDLWEKLESEMDFTTFNKLIISLCENRELNPHLNSTGELTNVIITPKKFLELRREMRKEQLDEKLKELRKKINREVKGA